MAWVSNSSFNNLSTPKSSSSNSQFIPARVTSIDQSTTLNNGNITAEILSSLATLPSQAIISASPLYPNIKSYPLVNEIVFLILAPSPDYSSNTESTKYYYISTLNLWNNVHVNPTPNPYTDLRPNSQTKTIAEIEVGSSNKSGEQDTNSFKPGTYFEEKSNIYPLYPFEGDILYEGRWGQSIRFGSTNIQSSGKTKTINKSQFKQASETFTSGNSNPSTLNHQLSVISSILKDFDNKYDNVKVSTNIEASESQVPNPNNLPKGALAQRRLESAISTLSLFPSLNKSIQSNTVIGSTPFVQGKDNPNDVRYTNEQYVKISFSITGTETTNIPETFTPLNWWSQTGNNGDPILIFRNGQNPELVGPAQSTTLEDINKDISSIYFTSTQKMPIEVSSKNDYLSYGENKPIDPKEYTGSQIILSSGRLLFNSTQSDIMLSSKKSININSLEGIYFDTIGPITLEASEIKLGSSDATESVLLGDSTVELLQNLIGDLVTLMNIMGSQIGNNGVILEPTATTARSISNNLSLYQSQLDDLKSNIVKVE